MKLRHTIILTALTLFISACNFTLAADVTPPPGYVPPSPMPTLGPLYPASAPDIVNGAAIYEEKCAACHGATGLGDGEQGKQLPVTVAAFALPETALKASPANWYRVVTQGNLDRFMPPFSSLSDQERWDVVSYALALHTTPEQIELGQTLFQTACPDCSPKFGDREEMAGLSGNDLIRIIKNGEGDIPAFGAGFTDEEAVAVAAYIRTLTFGLPPAAMPTTVPATQTTTAVVTEAGTPSIESTPVEGAQVQVTPEATAIPGTGIVRGSIDNQTGAGLPADLKVVLRGFEHGADPSAGPQEISVADTTVNPDGSFMFQNMGIPENRIFIAELEWDGIPYQSDFAIVEAGMTEILLPAITVHASTEDYSLLRVDTLQMYFDFANEQDVQLLAVYSITNATDKTILIPLDDMQEIPFIKNPKGAENIGYEAAPDSASFVPLSDGFAMPPSEIPYQLIAFASLPKTRRIEITQPVALPVAEVTVLVPEGVTAEGETLSDSGRHEFGTGTFNMYTSGGINVDGNISFTLSGEPKTVAVAPDVTQNQNLLIGVGALGMTLILAGAWMYWRDRNRVEEEVVEEEVLDDPESLMDAIIALDDLHRAGKLSDQAYQERREDLKNALKRKS